MARSDAGWNYVYLFFDAALIYRRIFIGGGTVVCLSDCGHTHHLVAVTRRSSLDADTIHFVNPGQLAKGDDRRNAL